jgi:hypothetical protein
MDAFAVAFAQCASLAQCVVSEALPVFLYVHLFGVDQLSTIKDLRRAIKAKAAEYETDFGVFGAFDLNSDTQLDTDGMEPLGNASVLEMTAFYETYCGYRFDGQQWQKRKNQQGVFYTPKPGVDYAIQTIQAQLDDAQSVLDPSMGCGAFVMAVFEYYCQSMTELEALERVYGVDIDPYAVSLVRIWFCRRVGVEHAGTVASHFRLGDSIHGMAWFQTFVDTHPDEAKAFDLSVLDRSSVVWFADFYDVALTKGFDVIVGNPPWHMMNIDEIKTFERAIGIEYPVHCGKGRADLWRLLVERCTWLLKPGGTMALYVPWSLRTQRDERYLRAYLVEKGNVETLVVFGNRVMFPSVSKGTILFTWQRAAPQGLVRYDDKATVVDGTVVANLVDVDISEVFPNHQQDQTKFSDVFKIKRGLQDDRNARVVPWMRDTHMRNAHFDTLEDAQEAFDRDIVPFHTAQGVLPFGIYRGFAERHKSRWRYGSNSKKAGQSKLRHAPAGLVPIMEGYESIVVKAKMSPSCKRRLIAAPCNSEDYGTDSVCFVHVPPLSYSPLFVLGLLNSDYLEQVINKNHPTTSSLNIGKLPFRQLETLEQPENLSLDLPLPNDPVYAYHVIIQCSRQLIDLRNAVTQALYHEERMRLGVDRLDQLTTDQRLDRETLLQAPEDPEQLDAHNATLQARNNWKTQSIEVYKVLNQAVDVYYNCNRLSEAS